MLLASIYIPTNSKGFKCLQNAVALTNYFLCHRPYLYQSLEAKPSPAIYLFLMPL